MTTMYPEISEDDDFHMDDIISEIEEDIKNQQLKPQYVTYLGNIDNIINSVDDYECEYLASELSQRLNGITTGYKITTSIEDFVCRNVIEFTQ